MNLRKNFHFLLMLLATVSVLPPSSFAQESKVPKAFRNWVHYEQVVNARENDTKVFAALSFEGFPEEYDPKSQTVFQLPYIEIPTKDLYIQKTSLPAGLQSQLFFTKDGQEHMRFFIHPLMEENYAKEIKDYGLKKDKFWATPSSSPRSLIVWNEDAPTQVFGQKVSLANKVGTVRRLNALDKLSRAHAIQREFQSIPSSIKKQLQFDFFPEPVVAHTPYHQYGNITREFPSELSYANGKTKLVAGFGLTASDGGDPILLNEIKKTSGSVAAMIEDKVFAPLVNSYAYLAFNKGLVGEPHQQNVSFAVDASGRLKGGIWYRDLDAFKPDMELRAVNGYGATNFVAPERPFKVLKLSTAPEYYAQSFRSHMRNNWVVLVERMLSDHKGKLSKEKAKEVDEMLKSKALWEQMDRLYLVNARKYLRHDALKEAFFTPWDELVRMHADRLERLFPRKDLLVDSLSADEWDKLLREIPVYEFVGWTKSGDHFDINVLPYDIQKTVAHYKATTAIEFPKLDLSQADLKAEFERLQFNFRASTRKKLPTKLTFEAIPGGILAYLPNNKLFGTALLEPEDSFSNGKNFYANVPKTYPRKKPNPTLFTKLWSRGNLAEKEALSELSCLKNILALHQ